MEKKTASLFLILVIWFSCFPFLIIETNGAETTNYNETYRFLFQPVNYGSTGTALEGLVFTGGHINVLIPPDASVVSVDLVNTFGSIELTNFSYQGTFNLRCYKFAQINLQYKNRDQYSKISFEVTVQRNSVDYYPCENDPLVDTIMERLKQCAYAGNVGPMYACLNLEDSEQWRGYPILDVKKNPEFVLPQQNVDYLVIVSEKNQPSIENLVKCKQDLGLDTFVMTIETIQEVYLKESLQLKIREFLKDAFNSWHMNYVLLVGNTGTIPPINYVAYDTINWGNDSRTTDHYYATLEQPIESFSYKYPSNTCVDFPDFILGRFPFENSEQITNLVEKTLDYDLNLSPGAWSKTNLFIRGQDCPYGSNYLLDSTRSNPKLIWEDQMRGINEGNLTLQAVVDFVKEGVGSILFACHADPYHWWLGAEQRLSVTTVEQLSTFRIPVIFSIGCHSGKFDTDPEGSGSAAVKLLAKSDGGAVAVVAGTSYSPNGDLVYISAYNSWKNCPVPQWRLPDANYDVGKAFYYYSALNPIDADIILLGDPTLVLVTAKYDLNFTQEKTPSQISFDNAPDVELTNFTVNISLALHSTYGNNLQNETVNLYKIQNNVKTPLATVTTDNGHYCNFLWEPDELEPCNILAEYNGSVSYYGSKSNVTFAFVTDNAQNVLTVESNSTVSELGYNPTNKDLTLTVNGLDSTEGYIKVTVPKSLTADSKNMKMYLDSNEAECSINQRDNSWGITLFYSHSSHEILIDLDVTVIPEFPSWIILPFFLIASLEVILYKKKINR